MIEKKSIGFLIDELFTTDHRCWNAQDRIMDRSLSDKERLDAAIQAQIMNSKRSQLIAAIDRRLGDGHLAPVEKSYSYSQKMQEIISSDKNTPSKS